MCLYRLINSFLINHKIVNAPIKVFFLSGYTNPPHDSSDLKAHLWRNITKPRNAKSCYYFYLWKIKNGDGKIVFY